MKYCNILVILLLSSTKRVIKHKYFSTNIFIFFSKNVELSLFNINYFKSLCLWILKISQHIDIILKNIKQFWNKAEIIFSSKLFQCLLFFNHFGFMYSRKASLLIIMCHIWMTMQCYSYKRKKSIFNILYIFG